MFIEATTEIASRITGAIRDAAAATGASFDYLLKTALRESNLNPDAKASSSSATGLFQFIDQTWLGTLKKAGASLGYGNFAESIERTSSGRYVVEDPAQRQAIMKLRTDPTAASAMAAAFTNDNAALLTKKLGRTPTDGELYIAHFMGPTGAVRLISATEASPNATAASMFPKAARANPSIFYGTKGGARSLSQVYASLIAKHNNIQAPPLVAIAAASGTTASQSAAVPSAAVASKPIQQAAGASSWFTTASAQAPEALPATAYAAQTGPVFHGLFRTDGRAPVAAVVSELWGAKDVQFPHVINQRADEVAPAAGSGKSSGTGGRPLELFRFLRPTQEGAGRPA
jgi:hypothetical protein